MTKIEAETIAAQAAAFTGNGAISDARAEIDSQVATAKKYPRSAHEFLQRCEQLATLSEDVAAGCMFALPRGKDDSGRAKMIEGPSARLAEIVANSWGNCRAAGRVVGEEAEHVVAQGVFHDLERNVAIQVDVRRRITDKNGRRYTSDMIVVTGNAAVSIALRNAIFRGVPKALWWGIYLKARQAAVGDAKTLSARRATAFEMLAKMGATKEQVLALLGKKGPDDVDLDDLAVLKGIVTSIRDGDSTVDEVFAAKVTTLQPSATAGASKAGGAEMRVTESTSLAPDAAADPKKQRKPVKLAAVPQDPASPVKTAVAEIDPMEEAGGEPADEDGWEKAEAAAAAFNKAAVAPPPAASMSQIGENTPIVYGDVRPADPPIGACFFLEDLLAFDRWDGAKWNRITDDEQSTRAYSLASNRLARRITQHYKGASRDRAAAIGDAKKELGLAELKSLQELTLPQLVDLAERKQLG